MTRAAWLAAAALVCGAALRFHAAFQPIDPRSYWQNDWEYYSSGVELARSGVYRPFPGAPPSAYRLPLYPSFIAVCRWIAPGPRTVRLAQAALDTAAIAGVFLLGSLALHPLCGAGAAWLYALGPIARGDVALLGVECFYSALVLLVALALAFWAKRPESARRAATAGAVLGASLLCRSTLFLLPAVVAFWLLRRGRAKPMGAFLAAALLLPLPWAVRNHLQFGRFIPFENGAAALNAWAGSSGEITNRHDLDPVPAAEAALLAQAHGQDESERAATLRTLSLNNILSRPLAYAVSCLRRLPELWREQYWLLLLALPLLASLRRLQGPAVGLALLPAYFCLHALMGVSPRYAHPVYGVLCVLAAGGVWLAFRKPLAPASEAAAGRTLAWAGAGLASLVVVCAVLLGAERRAYAGAPWKAEPALKRLNDDAVRRALTGDPDGALQIFNRILEQEPAFSEALISRAVLLERAGRGEEALADYRRASELLEGGAPLRAQVAPLPLSLLSAGVKPALARIAIDRKFQAAVAMLRSSPTGKTLLAPVDAGRVSLGLYDDGSVHYTDSLDEVHYSRDYVRDSEVWQTAVLLAHELEHAHQDELGLTGEGVRAARELTAFRVQCRAWVELGGKVRSSDLDGNRMNSHDMLGWLGHPKMIDEALLTRSAMVLELSRPDLKRYWDQVFADEASWRIDWTEEFPAADSRASAEYVVRQAKKFAHH